MTRKQKKKMQKRNTTREVVSKAGKGSDPGGHPHTDVKEKLAAIVTDTIERVQSDSSGSAPLRRMWGEEYEMPDPTTKEGGETTDSSVYSPFLCYFHSSFRYLLHLTQKIVLDTRWV